MTDTSSAIMISLPTHNNSLDISDIMINSCTRQDIAVQTLINYIVQTALQFISLTSVVSTSLSYTSILNLLILSVPLFTSLLANIFLNYSVQVSNNFTICNYNGDNIFIR